MRIMKFEVKVPVELDIDDLPDSVYGRIVQDVLSSLFFTFNGKGELIATCDGTDKFIVVDLPHFLDFALEDADSKDCEKIADNLHRLLDIIDEKRRGLR